MSEPEDVQLSASGGTVVRIGPRGSATLPPPAALDLAVLGPLRNVDQPGPYAPSGSTPPWQPGQLLTWHYGHSVEVLKVARDDERGLVAWLPSGSEQVIWVPADGRGLRDRPVAERFITDMVPITRRWTGPGILRIAPTGAPWSIWYFWAEDGSFEGHYVNLELPHERPADGSARTHTRDLILDLWVEDDEVWLKDADELDAAVVAGKYTGEQAEAIRALGDRARHELIEPWAWPLEEDWESWRAPAGWDEPLDLPAHLRPAGG